MKTAMKTLIKTTMSIVAVVLASPRPARAQTVGDVLTFLVTNQSVQTGSVERDRDAAQATSDTISRAVRANLATLPISTSSGAFVYRLNPELGTVERATSSYGPFFVERSLTAGLHQASIGLTFQHLAFTSLDGSPGGVPLYKNGQLVGGIGVTGDGIPGPIVGFRAENPFIYIAGSDKDEDVALAGQHGYAPSSTILATNVFINGIRLPYVNSSTFVSSTIVLRGNADSHYPLRGTPAPFAYPVATLGGVSGQIRQPIRSDPMAGTINGQPRLAAAEVRSILSRAAYQTSITRAAIRLPIGQPMKAFITVVNNPNAAGVAPTVLGTFRTGEATLFSWDVAVQKARTVIYYSSHDFLGFGLKVAMSVRCVGFLAQCNYPPGIDGNAPGPFNGQQERFSGLLGNHCNPSAITLNSAFVPNPNLPNGITIFPGAFGLYRNGVLIGAIGVSGDGVDQDDLVAAAGTHDFLAPLSIRSDQFFYRNTRLPYAKFPRDWHL